MLCIKCHQPIPDASAYCNHCGRKQTVEKRGRHSNGEGYTFRRGSTWAARVLDKARTHTDPSTGTVRKFYKQKGGFHTEKSARLWCMQYYNGLIEKPPAPTLSHYWYLYHSGEYEKLSPSRQQKKRIAWGKLTSLAGMAVDAITVSDLRHSVDGIATYYPARDIKDLLSALFDLAAADGYVQKDLPSFIILPKLIEKEADIFTDLEQIKLWQAYENGEHFAAWPLLMIYTGMMPGETQKLTASMIDLENHTITGAGLKTSTRKTSAVYFPDFLTPLLQDLMDRAPASGKLFPYNKDNIYKMYHEMMNRIGIRDLDPYSCRHTVGTALAVTANVAPETVRKLMRWAKGSRMISRYAHPDDHAAAAAIETLQKPSI